MTARSAQIPLTLVQTAQGKLFLFQEHYQSIDGNHHVNILMEQPTRVADLVAFLGARLLTNQVFVDSFGNWATISTYHPDSSEGFYGVYVGEPAKLDEEMWRFIRLMIKDIFNLDVTFYDGR